MITAIMGLAHTVVTSRILSFWPTTAFVNGNLYLAIDNQDYIAKELSWFSSSLIFPLVQMCRLV
jgi:hypothetical protein